MESNLVHLLKQVQCGGTCTSLEYLHFMYINLEEQFTQKWKFSHYLVPMGMQVKFFSPQNIKYNIKWLHKLVQS